LQRGTKLRAAKGLLPQSGIMQIGLTICILGGILNSAFTKTLTIIDYPGATGTFPQAIYGNQIIGYYFGGLYPKGFIFDYKANTWTNINVSWQQCGLYPVSTDGNNIAGYYADPYSNWEGFIYNIKNQSGTIWDAAGPSSNTNILGISGNHIIGYYYNPAFQGFVYDIAKPKRTNLVVPYGTGACPYAINGNYVVGAYNDNDGYQYSFIYNIASNSYLDFIMVPGSQITQARILFGNVIGIYDDIGHFYLYNMKSGIWIDPNVPGFAPEITGIGKGIMVGRVGSNNDGFIYTTNDADLNWDGVVDFRDFAIYASDPNMCTLSTLASNWLKK
jgi:hypothetical protein